MRHVRGYAEHPNSGAGRVAKSLMMNSAAWALAAPLALFSCPPASLISLLSSHETCPMTSSPTACLIMSDERLASLSLCLSASFCLTLSICLKSEDGEMMKQVAKGRKGNSPLCWAEVTAVIAVWWPIIALFFLVRWTGFQSISEVLPL